MLCLTIIIFFFLSGCVKPDTGFVVKPQAFSSPPDLYANETTTDVAMYLNDSMLVSFPWTPENGRLWRISVTEGLFVTGDRYIPYPPEIPVEESGSREWMVKAISPGSQMFIGTIRPRGNSWDQETVQKKIAVLVSDRKNVRGNTQSEK
jgi:predicted secreted protein